MTNRVPCLCLALALVAGGCTTATEHEVPRLTAADVEQLAIENGRVPLAGLVSSAQLTEAQFRALAEGGDLTIVCLRPLDEPGTGWEEELAVTVDVPFHRLPVAGPEDVSIEQARRLDDILVAADERAVIYCKSGNRVGALLAVRAWSLQGQDPEVALQLGRDAGLTRLEPSVRVLLGLPELPPPVEG